MLTFRLYHNHTWFSHSYQNTRADDLLSAFITMWIPQDLLRSYRSGILICPFWQLTPTLRQESSAAVKKIYHFHSFHKSHSGLSFLAEGLCSVQDGSRYIRHRHCLILLTESPETCRSWVTAHCDQLQMLHWHKTCNAEQHQGCKRVAFPNADRVWNWQLHWLHHTVHQFFPYLWMWKTPLLCARSGESRWRTPTAAWASSSK